MIRVSFMEVYNEHIYDLLVPFTKLKKRDILPLKENGKNVFVKGLREVEVGSIEVVVLVVMVTQQEAYEIVQDGLRQRQVSETLVHARSSRSHCIFNITVIQAPMGHNGKLHLVDENQIRTSCMSVVDLAGSERTSKTQTIGMLMTEA